MCILIKANMNNCFASFFFLGFGCKHFEIVGVGANETNGVNRSIKQTRIGAGAVRRARARERVSEQKWIFILLFAFHLSLLSLSRSSSLASSFSKHENVKCFCVLWQNFSEQFIIRVFSWARRASRETDIHWLLSCFQFQCKEIANREKKRPKEWNMSRDERRISTVHACILPLTAYLNWQKTVVGWFRSRSLFFLLFDFCCCWIEYETTQMSAIARTCLRVLYIVVSTFEIERSEREMCIMHATVANRRRHSSARRRRFLFRNENCRDLFNSKSLKMTVEHSLKNDWYFVFIVTASMWRRHRKNRRAKFVDIETIYWN